MPKPFPTSGVINVIIFLFLGLILMTFVPPILWRMGPDVFIWKGAAKGGIVVVFCMTLLTRLFLKSDKESFAALGVHRSRFFIPLIVAIIVGVLVNAVIALALSLWLDFKWLINPKWKASGIVFGLLVVCWSAVAEELIYRGYAYRKSIQLFGPKMATIFLVFLFAMVHWYAWGAWGDLSRMANVLLTVGLGGFIFSLSLLKTGSLLWPIGWHVGAIWANADLFTGMFARWYNNEHGLFIATDSPGLRHALASQWLINLPFCVVSVIVILVLIRLPTKLPMEKRMISPNLTVRD